MTTLPSHDGLVQSWRPPSSTNTTQHRLLPSARGGRVHSPLQGATCGGDAAYCQITL